MKIYLQKITLLILLFSISPYTFSQNSAAVKGTVTDGKLPIEFVDVMLRSSNDSTKVVRML